MFMTRGLPLCRLHINKGADIEAKDPYDFNSTPIMVAARNGILPVIDLLISSGADINAADELGYTALHAACVSRRLDIIAKLLENGAHVNVTTKKGITALHFLCLTINNDQQDELWEIVRLFLKHGANPLIRIHYTGMHWDARRSALETVILRSYFNVAYLILAKSFTRFNRTDIWRLFLAVIGLSDSKFLYMILNADRKKSILRYDQSLLHLLKSRQDTTAMTKILLDQGAPYDGASTKDGGNTVFWAVRNQKGPEILRRILQGGANPNVIFRTRKSRQCPLLEALKFGNAIKRRTYTKLLLDYGARIDFGLGLNARPTLFYLDLVQPPLLRKIESVADILLSPSSLQRVPEARQVALMVSACRLTHVKLLQMLLLSGSINVVQKFVDQFKDALPISWLLDVKQYPQATGLTIQHMNFAITIMHVITRYGTNWDSMSLDFKWQTVGALRHLMAVTSNSSWQSIGASWCLHRRISIANADNGDPKFTLSPPNYPKEISQNMTLYDLGRRVAKMDVLDPTMGRLSII
ncbi:ankyrin repeat-containing domain protein [Jackrogersella minutella]|nr:ankyrin repeat-containing domain protein [Jackrogersella minutella]